MRPGVLHVYLTHSDVWVLNLDSFKAASKETGGNRNVIPMQRAMNRIDCKEFKRKSVATQQGHS